MRRPRSPFPRRLPSLSPPASFLSRSIRPKPSPPPPADAAGRRRLWSDPVARTRLLPILFCLLGSAACSVSTDAEFYPPVTDSPFVVTGVALPLPADQAQPINPTITLSLSDLPDAATVQFPALRLSTRSGSLEFLAEVSLVDRSIRVRPKKQLLPENDYYVVLGAEIQALSGQPLRPVSVPFRTGSFVDPAPPGDPVVTLGQLLTDAAGLRARCAQVGCHTARDAGGGSTAQPAQGLSFDAAERALADFLAVTPARGSVEGLLLVQPGVPERSYLLRKLIAGSGFARIVGAPMPPPGLPGLDAAFSRALERWIRQGAH